MQVLNKKWKKNPLPLVRRAGVGGLPETSDLVLEFNPHYHGAPPSLALPHEGGGDL